MLEVRDLVAGYGGVPVVHGVDIHVAEGELLLVLGPNGAGKSTLLRALAGFVKVTSGRVTLAGTDVTNRRPEQLAREGLRLVFDGHRVFPGLSVRDNLRLGGTVVRSRADVDARIDEVFGMFAGLDRRRDAQAHQLSGGERQMLALGQAFVSRPRVLLCDEPSLGLAQALLPGVWEFLAARAAEGTAVIVVEQLVDTTLALADRAVVLDRGAIAATGSASEVLRGPVLRDIYFRDPRR